VYLCTSQAQTLEQAHEMASLGFCEAPRVVAAKIDRDRQEPRKLFDTFLLVSSLADLLENILATPAIVDMLILLVKYDFFSFLKDKCLLRIPPWQSDITKYVS